MLTLMKHVVAEIISTLFGIGKIKFAPGTMGSLATLVLFFFIPQINAKLHIPLWSLTFIGGLWAVKVYITRTQQKDPSEVVIDEVLGQWIALWPILLIQSETDQKLIVFGAAFVLFRFFDIKKILYIKKLDQKSKSAPTPALTALYVILDDIVAGIVSGVILRFALSAFPSLWGLNN